MAHGGPIKVVKLAIAGALLLVLVLAAQAFAAAGQLDPSFSGDGLLVDTPPGSLGSDEIRGVAVDHGKVVTAGSSYLPSPDGPVTQIAVTRYKANGKLDKTFSGDGRVFTSTPGSE